MILRVGFLLAILVAVTMGCFNSVHTMAAVEKFVGKVVSSDGQPLANLRVILQPTQDGYEIELEVNERGEFQGEGIPGKYIYYFAHSSRTKAKFPATIPSEYLEPKMEHLVLVAPAQEVICEVNLHN